MIKEEIFKIDRGKMRKIVQEFQQQIAESKDNVQESIIINNYVEQIIQTLGNDNLQRAINKDSLIY